MLNYYANVPIEKLRATGSDCSFNAWEGGGGAGEGTPLYKLYTYEPPPSGRVFAPFGLKTGTHFAHFGLESGWVFEGTTGVYERIYCFNSKGSKKEREICEFETGALKNVFCLRYNLRNDNIISA